MKPEEAAGAIEQGLREGDYHLTINCSVCRTAIEMGAAALRREAVRAIQKAPQCPKCHRAICSLPQAAYRCEECDEGVVTETDLADPTTLLEEKAQLEADLTKAQEMISGYIRDIAKLEARVRELEAELKNLAEWADTWDSPIPAEQVRLAIKGKPMTANWRSNMAQYDQLPSIGKWPKDGPSKGNSVWHYSRNGGWWSGFMVSPQEGLTTEELLKLCRSIEDDLLWLFPNLE